MEKVKAGQKAWREVRVQRRESGHAKAGPRRLAGVGGKRRARGALGRKERRQEEATWSEKEIESRGESESEYIFSSWSRGQEDVNKVKTRSAGEEGKTAGRGHVVR